MPVSAVIFDYGGVIVRIVDENPRRQIVDRLGIDLGKLYHIVFESESARCGSRGEISFALHWKYACGQLGVPKAEQAATLEAFLAADEVDQDLMTWIRELHKNHKIGLLSNAWDNLRGLLEDRWKVAGEFDDLVISAEAGMVKPDQRIYELAVKRLGVLPEEAVFFDDVLENIEGARAAGLQAYQYTNVEQAKKDLKV
jgi:epoxide hydrolase-like predicted phosphatase